MILETCFLIGLFTGLCAGLILFYILFYDDIRAVKEFNERQGKYKRMI